ncbi:non-ribosomal peptide synthase/polyketide synthase [Bradyrhizobium sp. HKCCYLS20291]|uniref:non-ribosomal peptide synthetase n=1 Tax=Bradyrhizobium sp. HKCCYLS20291 TaxID=3420766 RepID=UPI003EBC3045
MSSVADNFDMTVEVAPLSSAQARLWQQVSLDPANPAYHVPAALRLRGVLDRRALQLSLDALIGRHEMLRTTFDVAQGETLQIIHPHLPVAIRAGGAIAEGELQEAIRLEIHRPFDLACGPLIRAVIFDLNDRSAVLLVTMHHLVTDGWSMGIFVSEFSTCYRAFATGGRPALPPLEIQYADFADWERERLETLEPRQLGYWREQLCPPVHATEVLPDYPRPPVPGTRGATECFELDVLVAARQLANSLGATLFMVLLAAFKVVLQRHTQADEIVLGSPVAGRNHADIEPLIGFFVNTQVLRVDVSGDPSFAELVARVRQTTLAAWDNQDLPFDKLVSALKPERRPARRPFCDLMFALQNAPRAELELPGLTIDILPVFTDTAKFDMTVICEETPRRLDLRIEYATDLYDAATVRRLAASFEQVIRAACVDPQARITTMPVVAPAELDELLGPRRGPALSSSVELTLTEWLRQTAARYPDRVAVSSQDEQLTYAALMRRSASLAGRLQRAGVRRGDRVALAVERSIDLVVAILGILRTGAAYVPLDAAYPTARLAFMLADSHVSAAVTHGAAGSIAEALGAAVPAAPVIRIDDINDGDAETFVDVAITASDAAYVIYTSGSTGKPKGVVVTHGNATGLFTATAATFDFNSDDVWTLFHSYAFDFSVWEIWGALLYGGRLVIVSHTVSRTPDAFRELVDRERVTVLNQTPSAFAQFDAADERAAAASADVRNLALRHVVFGGEALDPAKLSAWFARHGDERPVLTNMYGITETTVHVTHRRLGVADTARGAASVIGLGIDDLSLIVLDPRLQPVPIGTPGELFVGGRGVARGYLGRPELTAERFIPDPYRTGRLYRTGDRVRWVRDGGLAFFGRLDNQVKIRGFRIELGEIEQVLRAAGLRDVAVLPRDDDGTTRLVVYGVATDRDRCSPATLREVCAAALPGYMVPAAYVLLDVLPLTQNGKLDVGALAAPDFGQDTARDTFVAPRTEIEKRIAAIWQEMLGVERVGLRDNFFALGGDSIMMLQMAARIGRAGYSVARRDLIECQTVGDLAGRAKPASAARDRRRGAGAVAAAPARAVPAATGDIEDEYALTPLQEGLLFQSLYAPEDGHYVEQLHAPLQGDLDVTAFTRAWQTVIDRHAVLRTSFHWRDGERAVQRVARNVRFALDHEDWRELAPSEQEARLAALLGRDRARGFDFRQAPLMRVILLQLAPGRWHWIWTHHHLILDGWCLTLVVGEVLAAYDAYRRGVDPVLPQRRPYRDFIAWLATQDAEAARTFWRGYLQGFKAPNRLDALQGAAPGRAAATGTGERDLVLAVEETTALQEWARSQHVTLNTVVSACWARVLAACSHSDDVVFGVTVSGRPSELEGFEHMIGLFINTLPMRVRLDADAPLGAWLRELQAQQAAMRVHEHARLVDIQRESGIRVGDRLFETLLVFENYPVDPANLQQPAGLALGPVTFLERTNYPLAIAAIPGPGLTLRLYYDRARFSDDVGARILSNVAGLLRDVVAKPAYDLPRRLADWAVPPLADQQGSRAAELAAWNDTARDLPPVTFPDLFAAQAAESPDAIAVVDGDESLSYAALEARANQLAHHLHDLGVGPETVVGLCVERSPALLVGLLGILKAGGVYLPLDPSYPDDRIGFMLNNAGASALVTHAGLRYRLCGSDAPRSLILLDADQPALAKRPATAPASRLDPQNAAYVIYTSGSTGTPKGVVITHAGLANKLVALRDDFAVGADFRSALVISSAFDAAIEQTLLPLVGGGAAIIVSNATREQPAAFWQQMVCDRVTFMSCVPSFLGSVLAGAPNGLRLQHLALGGEALTTGFVRQLSERIAVTRLTNLYGPTEATIDAAAFTVDGEQVGADVPIGRPMPNYVLHVLDTAKDFGLDPVATGEAGELHIAGLGLARGYRGNAGLTAERFVANPFGPPGSRMYRTGDLARRLADGLLEFAGRVDAQLKIRGFRIEPGEIEAALAACPSVAQAAVIAREDVAGHQRLVGYAVPRAGETIDPARLRAQLGRTLPDYMVPAAIVVLDRLPLSTSGKLDRRALPAPDLAPAAPEAPHTPQQDLLCWLFAKVLGLKQVGIDDNFFALGGDSILSLQIVSGALAAGLRISPRNLFEHPTVRELAAVAVAAGVESAEAAPGDVPLTPIQRWFFARGLAHRNRWNQSVVLEVDPRVTPDMLQQALHAAAREHDALRLRYEGADGPTQRLPDAGTTTEPLPCVVASVPADAPSTRDALLQWTAPFAEQAQAGLDLASGPLARAVIFPSRSVGEPSHLLLVAHHLVIGGVSWRILTEGLQQRLKEQLEGRPLEPLVRSVSFATWARRLAGYAATAALPVDYWLALADREPPALPIDRPDATVANIAASLNSVDIVLDAEITAALLRKVPKAYNTRAQEPLVAACAAALAEWTGVPRVLLDLESHGREALPGLDLDLSRTLGWFTSVYPVSLELPSVGGVGATLCAVKEQLRQIPSNGTPFGLMVAYSEDRDLQHRLARVPQPKVTFNYLGQFDQAHDDGALLRLTDLPSGQGQHGDELRSHVLDIVAMVRRGELVTSFQYSEALHDRDTIVRLADGFERQLRALIDHCLQPGAGAHTPSDFPLSRITSDALMRLEQACGPIEDLHVLSPMQQGLFFHALAAPNSDLYLQQLHGELRGDLDIGAFELAWRDLVRRHAIFRGRFVWEGLAEPHVVVLPTAEIEVAVQDWRGIDTSAQELRLAELLRDDRRRGMALDRAPLMRVTLVRRDDRHWHFLWTHHHVLLDGWCIGLVLREVLDGYEARRQGTAVEPAVRRPYRDYIAWLQRQDRIRADAFWRAALADFTTPTRLSLPAAPAGTITDEFEAAGEAVLSLSEAATAAIEAFARKHRLTVNSVLTGAWARLLASYAHSDDIVFGVTMAGRPVELEGADRMIGLFINTLPQRVRIQSGVPVIDWLHALQDQQLALREFDHCRLVDIQRESGVEQGVPLFETLIAFDNYPVDEALAQGFRDIEVAATRGVERTHYPLSLSVVPGRQLRVRALFDRRRISDAAAAAMLVSLQYLLESLSSGAVETVDDWSLVPSPQRLPLPAPVFGREDTLPQRFARAAAAHPDRIAVSCGDSGLSYRELSARAGRLAHHLREAGAGPESLVGLYLERTVDVVVGILGILQAGAAYVPIDPRAPVERIGSTVADAGLKLIVTESALLDALDPAARGTASVVVLDRDAASIARHPAIAPPAVISPANAAYVIYTSGSTGRPKGCVVTHANVIRLFDVTQKSFAPSADDVWMLFHSVAFDFSVWELWGALLHGGRLVVVPHDVSRSPERMHELLRRERVTILNQTPSAFRQLAAVDAARQQGDQPPPLALRHVIFGGEALQLEELRDWIARRGEVRPVLTNMYGITETTVHVTERCIRQADLATASGSVIGDALADLSLTVLDPFGLSLPQGVVGELFVGGAGVARGYLHRAALTAERFLPGPGGQRLYRSGDLVRQSAADVEYLGRIDQQVKVRGFRIELGEIEAALLDSPAVAMTTVQAFAAAQSGQQRLIAYVVPRGSVSVALLREQLARRLPDYMIPSLFVLLDQLPLTVNGKIDRRALPSPESAQCTRATASMGPSNDIERVLAAAFAAGLELDHVGVDNNFFALGGDSIRSIRVLSHARAAGVALEFGDLFSHPSVAALAAHLAAGSAAGSVERPIGPFELVAPEVAGALDGDVEAAYPLTRLQHGMLLETLDADTATTYHDVMSYHLQAPWDHDALKDALAVVVARHDILRSSIRIGLGPEPLQLIHRKATIPLAVDDLTALSAAGQDLRIETWGRAETAHAFELAQAPLLRVQVHRRSASMFQFSLSFHHAILDGWSVATLLTELFAAYAERLGYPVAPLPPPPTATFRDYIANEREMLTDADERRFWSDYVEGARPTLLPRLPRPHDAAPQRRVRSFAIPIAAETSMRLEQLAGECAVPLRTVLLAAHVRALSVICGESDVVTGLVTNGRPERQDGERVLGLFLGTLPFRLRVDSGNWRALVAQVHEVEKRIASHRRFPLAEIQRLAGQALFETDFNFVHFHVFEQALRMHDAFRVLGARGFEETGFTLAVNFGLTVEARALAGSLDLDTNVITEAQGASYAGIYGRVLKHLAHHTDEDVGATGVLDADQADALIAAGRAPQASAPACLPELVGHQMARTPDAVAVVAGDQSLTFAELDRRANQLAHLLLARGIRPDAVVAVCTGSSCDRVVALLAILRAGAAYLLLEAEQPRTRTAEVLADAGARAIIVDDTTAGRTWPAGVEIIPLSEDLLAAQRSAAPAVAVLPDNLAYIISTSGSTGRPKCVQITHRAIANHMAWMRRAFPLGPGDRVLQKTPVAFDASVWEFWAPLVEGASLVLVPDGSHRDADHLVRMIRDERITVLQLVPTLLRALLDVPEWSRCDMLRRLFVGGEPLSRDLARRALAIHPGLELVNLYGPAETTIDATSCVVRAEHELVAIGQPVDGTAAFVLDEAARSFVPAGTDGELHLGGVGLARGYAGRPGWTAASFVPDALTGEAGARLYATGDRARWVNVTEGDPALALEFRGRADDQVKLHGQRVELGEIDAALRSHAAVQEAVTLLIDDGARQRLVAHIVGAATAADDLRNHLVDRLPRALIPVSFVHHDVLPQTTSGKIDRRALAVASTDVAAIRPARSHVPPRSDVERLLTDIFADVLRSPQIGISDDFYELGGDSIMALQIVSRLRSAGWRLSPRRILEHPTIARLAPQLVPLNGDMSTAASRAAAGIVPLAPIQRDFLARLDAIAAAGLAAGRVSHWNQSVLLTVPAALTAEQAERAVRAVAAIHDATRLRFRRTDTGWQQRYESADAATGIAFEAVDLSAVHDWQNELTARAELAQAGLDLDVGPVGRAVHFTRDNEPGRLLLVLHHLVVDAVSWRILLEDLATALRQVMLGDRIQLPPASNSYSEWVSSIDARARSADTAPWLALVGQHGASAIERFAEGGLVPSAPASNLVKDADKVRVRLTATETSALLRTAPTLLRTRPEEMLLAAFLDALSPDDAASSLWLDLEGHGREEMADTERSGLDLSRTVGWFTALYPVCLQRPAGSRGGDLLRSVKRCLRALSANGADFGALLHLSPDPHVRAQLAALPRRDIAFNFLGHVDAGKKDQVSAIGIQPAPESCGHDHDPHGERHYLLELIARVSDGELIIDWIFPGGMIPRAAVERRAADMVLSLKTLMASDPAAAAAPSDFPLLQLADDELDALLAEHPDTQTILPPSPLQDGLLFHALDDDQPGVYVQQITAAIDGRIDRRAFEAAWDRTLARHDALRASFHRGVRDGRSYSIMHHGLRCPISWLDWRNDDADTRWRQMLRDDRARGFQLDRPPLMRVTVVQIAERSWRLLWSHHHLLLDGWSLPLVLGDVIAHYRALTEGTPAPVASSAAYSDYLVWLSRRDDSTARAHWRELLQGLETPSTMQLPAAAGPELAASAGETHGEIEFVLSNAETTALSALARSGNVTLAAVIQAWWAHLVARFSGRRDVVFGVTLAGRSAPLSGIETTVGLFINTLPLRVDVPAGCPLLQLAARSDAARAVLAEYEHSRLVDVQQLADLPRGTPLFDSILVFQNYPLGDTVAPLADFTVRDLAAVERTHYPLTCFVMPGDGLHVRLVYDAKRFSREGVVCVLAHGRSTLLATIENPLRPLEAFDSFPPRECDGLIQASGKIAEGDSWTSLHDQIAAMAARDPDRTAIVCGDDVLTYRQLIARAGRVTAALIQRGFGSEDLVGICLDRSVDMVVALLGVLGSGAAYVPLDPRFPRARLELMLAESSPRAVLTGRTLAAELADADMSERPLLALADLVDEAGDVVRPGAAVQPGNLAYVIFTSGSTGRPKGVQVTHGALVNVIRSFAATPGLSREDTLLAVTTLSFDIAALELLLPLTVGARLVLASADQAADAEELANLITSERATVMQATPATWRMLIAAGWAGAPDLSVWSGGEALPADLAAELLARSRGLWNLYGPTETTIWSLAGAVNTAADTAVLARPIAATSVYVADAALELAPPFVPGELLIAGDGLARGYRGQPGLTAERFVPDVFGGPGARAYRTGDEVRSTAAGFAFLGRLDQQVKIRGFRVELGEIGAALRTMPAVADAVVVKADYAGHPRLVAYVVPSGTPDANLRQTMQEALSALLPGYMLPSAYMVLDALPLTPNGKIDRQSLPAPDAAAAPDRTRVAPRNSIEQAIAAIWQDVLGLPLVGVTDNFFDLGGQSLQAASLLATLRQAFKVKLPMRTLFAGPTVEQLAMAIMSLEERPGLTQQIAQALVRLQAMSPEAKALLRERQKARNESSAEGARAVAAKRG